MNTRKGILTSYLIGLPSGLITIFIVFVFPAVITGEGLATMGLIFVYGKAIIGLIISFIIALATGGHYASKDIQSKKPLIKASFKYSLIVNSIIWISFIVIMIIETEKEQLVIFLIPPLIAFILCTAISTFTIGLFICRAIKSEINIFSETK